MAYSFNFNETNESYFFRKKDMDSLIFPNNLGQINTYRDVTSEDISLIKMNMNSNDDFSILVDTMSDTYSMVINIVLHDQVYKYDYIADKEETQHSNNIFIGYKNRLKSLFKVNKYTETKDVGIMIKNSFLEENFFCHLRDEKRREIEENCKNSMQTLFKSSSMSRKTLALANDIYSSPFSGAMHSIYLQGKVYEIIYEEFMSIINEKGYDSENRIILAKDDTEALHKAKEIIVNEKKHSSIGELAKEVAINEKKLYYGFKKLFNTTPGNMILETKMNEAKRLLEETDYNINEVADITGYKYSQNFTKAFIRFFGKRPSDVMKSRSYYY